MTLQLHLFSLQLPTGDVFLIPMENLIFLIWVHYQVSMSLWRLSSFEWLCPRRKNNAQLWIDTTNKLPFPQCCSCPLSTIMKMCGQLKWLTYRNKKTEMLYKTFIYAMYIAAGCTRILLKWLDLFDNGQFGVSLTLHPMHSKRRFIRIHRAISLIRSAQTTNTKSIRKDHKNLLKYTTFHLKKG